MAKAKETTQEKKLRRNKQILEHYNELKKQVTTRKAQEMLADIYNVSNDTITKILFVPTYSNSPLPKTVATMQTNTVPLL